MTKYLVIPVHGIYWPVMEWMGNFQKEMEALDEEIVVRPFRYGFIPAVLAWVMNINRLLKIHYGLNKLYINRLHAHVKRQVNEFPDAKLVLIGHSFGGWLNMSLLEQEPSVQARTIIFIQSPIPRMLPLGVVTEVPFIYNWHSPIDPMMWLATLEPGFGDAGNFTVKNILPENNVEVRELHSGVVLTNFQKYKAKLREQIRS